MVSPRYQVERGTTNEINVSSSNTLSMIVACVSGFLTLCYLYPTGGLKNRPKILARRHLLTN